MILNRSYLNILVGCFTGGFAIVMFIVAIEAPKPAMDRLERSNIGIQLFSFRGRYMVDLVIALFLFAMPPWGIVLGVATLLVIFGIRFLGVKQPDAFNEIFRQGNDMDSHTSSVNNNSINNHHNNNNNNINNNDTYTLESEYDTPVVERR
jgi:hypothetical protein